jgi:tRNA A-37 threonylcarbamoyl transferase component Bud32/CheY-like chemotaxis protein
MADLDANTAGQQLLQIGLVTDAQLGEAWDVLGGKGGPAAPLLTLLERKGHLTPWQSSKFLNGDRKGFLLGGCKILYKISSGTFGRVFRAQDPQTGRVVAIKVLRRHQSEKPERIDLFLREGRIGMSLHHPNIVEILAVNVDLTSNQYYIVMEFVEGANLRELLAIRRKLEPVEALRIIEDCANGLAYAWSHGVTHRDIKLTNILLSSQGQAKLVDFGLANIESSLTSDDGDRVERTVDYAGLEKATNVKSGDVRSDIYFLGCVLFEMLSGRSPLAMSRDKAARMRKQRFDAVQPLGPGQVSGPPSLYRLVETMMVLNPFRRFQTPSVMVEAIRQVRSELEGTGNNDRMGLPQSIFVVESDLRLQDALRKKLKELGYRVFIASDPVRALDRFRQHPFEGLVVDGGTTAEAGLEIFQRVTAEADRLGLTLGAILILSEDQADWEQQLKPRPMTSVLVRPVMLKQLLRQLQDLVPRVRVTAS